MPTVSVRVPDDLKRKMEEYDHINWSAILRSNIEETLDELNSRSLARAVAASERLSREIDPTTAADTNTADTIRAWRDERYGDRSSR